MLVSIVPLSAFYFSGSTLAFKGTVPAWACFFCSEDELPIHRKLKIAFDALVAVAPPPPGVAEALPRSLRVARVHAVAVVQIAAWKNDERMYCRLYPSAPAPVSLTFSALGTVAELPQPASLAVAVERLLGARPVVAPGEGHALGAVHAGPADVAAEIGCWTVQNSC